jgi:hypothetical protein
LLKIFRIKAAAVIEDKFNCSFTIKYMNQTLPQQTSLHRPAVSLARLSQPHGYRFDGDSVHLHARLTVLDHAADKRSWALQLWACPAVPASASELAGQMVAEVALPPMSEVADEIEHMDMSTFACPPAGGAEHFMVLVLAAGAAGRFDEVHDIVAYPRRQQFVQPRMRGSVDYRIAGDRVHFSVEHIENPRETSNCSGTLALELWALATPYAGGAFEGTHLAGVSIGSLFGQAESTTTSFDLPFFSPPSGNWNFVLMLREWTPAGYVTRDFSNLITPVNDRSPSVLTPPKPKEAEAVQVKPPVTAKAAPTASAPNNAAVKPVAKATRRPRNPSGSKSAQKKRPKKLPGSNPSATD